MSNTQWNPCRLSRGVRPIETVFGDRDISQFLHNPHRACTAIIVLKPQSVCVAGGGVVWMWTRMRDEICLSNLSVKLGLSRDQIKSNHSYFEL